MGRRFLRLLWRRLAVLPFLLLGVSLVSFLLTNVVPGDPVAVKLLAETRLRQQRPAAALEALRAVESAVASPARASLGARKRELLDTSSVYRAIP